MGIMKTYELELQDAGQAACEDFYRKHRRPPDDCSNDDIAECLPLSKTGAANRCSSNAALVPDCYQRRTDAVLRLTAS